MIPGTPQPSSRLYNLSRSERKAMEAYIGDSLASGLIRSTSLPTGQSLQTGNSCSSFWDLLTSTAGLSRKQQGCDSPHLRSKNTKPDAFSRQHEPPAKVTKSETILPATCFIRSAVWDIRHRVLRTQQQHSNFGSGPASKLFCS